jgi:hypothetical protein
VTILSLVGKNGQMSESTNASNTGCADKVRLCLFIARRNGHTAVGDYVEVECKNESLQLVPNCKHVQMPSDTCSCCAAATLPSSEEEEVESAIAERAPVARRPTGNLARKAVTSAARSS